MDKAQQLGDEDREFFRLVWRAAFMNPFTEERGEVDRQISGASGSRGEVLAIVMERVTDRITALGFSDAANVRKYTKGDRDILTGAVLFLVFHRYMAKFDAFIEERIADPEGESTIEFGHELMGELMSFGLARKDSAWFLAVFYQLRRAYYFIETGLIGSSASMHELQRNLWNNVFTHDMRLYDHSLWNRMEDFSTLLLGETGTGKGTAAAAIGRSAFIPYDDRRGRFVDCFTRAFVPINLSQFPEALIESELFGHKKGAFTGAVDQHEGIFSRCSKHGAIFLDEIGDVGIPIQIKLLQVLQERTFSPVGSHERYRFEGRVIAATNKRLDMLRLDGTFRDDFYYRLCSDQIEVPPLRQRIQEDGSELERLLRHILTRLCGECDEKLLDRVQSSLLKTPGKDYSWPGNVRELEQATRRILVKGSYQGDTAALSTGPVDDLQTALSRGDMEVDDLVALYCSNLHKRHGTYGEVARRTGLDWRTVKKYVQAAG